MLHNEGSNKGVIVRVYYQIEKRIICVDAPQSRHPEVLARELAPEAKRIDKEAALSFAKAERIDVEWRDLEGKF